MASEFVHPNPFLHKSVILDGTAVAYERTVLHMWANAVRTADPPTTTQTADGTNPWNLLHTTRTDVGIDRGQYRSCTTG
ncbi:hypothetical protein [Paenibacillus sp. AD87]|uniref:hypothetical protein n=1 Tax=Paenibacillus sp. AD87 TaxID=1528787 RepID=UPI0018D3F4CC|nr:hypothetical protein [Paenibacillus sp. AD87]